MNTAMHRKLVHEIYTPLSEIQRELPRRRNDQRLMKNVADFLGRYLLQELTTEPKAVLSRTIISPNTEFRYFLDIAQEAGLRPLGLEYHDTFVARNPDKYHLARLYFAHTRKNGTRFLSSMRVVDFHAYEGKNVTDIQTIHGASLIAFHHHLLMAAYPDMHKNIVDISQWFQTTRHASPFYYVYFLALFVCHGVLCDNFLLGDKGEADFFSEKVYPSFQEIQKMFGVKPLIYPLLPIENEKDRQWMAYEAQLKPRVEAMLHDKIMKQQ